MSPISLPIAPQWYHRFVRPKWFTQKYIHQHIRSNFNLHHQVVLDFGSGTGANCPMVHPSYYLGVDPDAKRIEYARKLYPQHTFQVFDRKTFPVEDNSVDCILIIAVLHHIPSQEIAAYMSEFVRILKPDGRMIVMEPCICKSKPICSWFMKKVDKGAYIRDEEGYLKLFPRHEFECSVLKRFHKCFLYHELFFSARRKSCAYPRRRWL
ncbi:class I SAM-dependent methyltransferase [Xylanibacillus composti]|uniref:Methyltransferase type 11 domain-containing protein n=1 Tax=Xylanibacillus composti TaxID=1572762 RepID=A0A8J4M204_9BACL|nr:class I SAM-dependent methyltransferase [Xylanibacillus composti]GIQ68407.1 hypothetical protein XYCOK13_12310 [Xylanibacillus composti]